MSRCWPGSSLEFNNCYLQLVGVTTPARGNKLVNSQGFENNKLRQFDKLCRVEKSFHYHSRQPGQPGLETGESFQFDLDYFNFATWLAGWSDLLTSISHV